LASLELQTRTKISGSEATRLASSFTRSGELADEFLGSRWTLASRVMKLATASNPEFFKKSILFSTVVQFHEF
jgi:DNA-binding IclR family transcriptional regulator